jgi:CelD/BcsL family acetyltransferase involved in cellulose biosynthesis
LNIHTATNKLKLDKSARSVRAPLRRTEILDKKIDVLTSAAEILAIKDEWRTLEIENAIPASVFQSHEWVRAWCATYFSADDGDKIKVYAGYQNGELVFLLPLAKSSHNGVTVLQWLTEPLGQYGDVLCAKGQDVSEWMRLALSSIKKENATDVLRLRHVRQDGLVENYAKADMLDGKYHERAPYLDLRAYKNETEYDARYTSVQRKRRKKIRKRLEEKGAVTFNKLRCSMDIDKAIETAILEKNNWLSDRGRYNRIMGCPRHVNFLKSLAKTATDSFSMTTTELSAGNSAVSWEIAFRYRGTHFAYITSHVNALTDLSPGRLHMDLSQRAALADHQSKFDLMVPYDQHKESWCSAMINVNDYYLGLSPKGRVYGAGYLRVLRPIVRNIYYKMPPWSLRLLQSCTARLTS